MIQVDLPAAFTVGHLFALLSRDYLKKEPKLCTSKLLGPLNVYMSCVFSPVALFLLVCWPAWEGMYIKGSAWLENPFDRPLVAGAYALFVIVMMLLANGGYILAHHWYRTGRDKWVTVFTIIGFIATFSPFVIRWGVWWDIGTYAEVTTGQGYSFFKPPFLYGWGVFMSYLIVFTILTGFWFRRKGNKIDA